MHRGAGRCSDAGRGYSPAVLALWLDVISRWVPKGTVSEILDIGCGTGRYSTALAAHFNARVIAVDPSEKMLAEARKKATERVRYERASAESLPLPDASIDMVFMSRSLTGTSSRVRLWQGGSSA